MFLGMFEKTEITGVSNRHKKKRSHKVASFNLSLTLLWSLKAHTAPFPAELCLILHTSSCPSFLLGQELWETLGSGIHKAVSQNPCHAFKQ